MLASAAGNKDIVEDLLAHGAEVNIQDENDYTALFYAVYKFWAMKRDTTLNYYSVIESNQEIADFLKPWDNDEIVQILLRNNANVNDYSSFSNDFSAPGTPLILAVQAANSDLKLMSAEPSQYMKVTKTLVDNGADVDATDKWGNSALMYAIMEENTNMAEYLLGNNASVEYSFGLTALSLAEQIGNDKIIKLIQNHSENKDL